MPMSSPEKNEVDDAALRARLKKLQASLREREEIRRAEAAERAPSPSGSFGRSLSVGLTVFSEFVAAILVGSFIGWQLDAWIGTKPLLLVVFLGLGTAAGFWNVYRVVARQQAPPGDTDAG
jgi:ATP synthase protein I